MATSMVNGWVVSAAEGHEDLEEMLKEAIARMHEKPRIDLTELYLKGYMTLELDENGDLISPVKDTGDKS